MQKKLFNYLNRIPFLQKSPAAPIIFLEIIFGFALSLLSLKIFSEIAETVLSTQTQSLDVAISHSIYALRTPLLTPFMYLLSFLGEGFVIIGAVLVTILLALKRYKHEAILFVSVIFIGALLNLYLKDVFQRPRPNLAPLIDLSHSYSFPSGHAMNSFIFYSVLVYLFFHFTRNKKMSIIASCLAAVLILLIGFSRVYLGVHYPSDVLAGFMAGFFVFITVILLDRTLIFFRIKSKKNKSLVKELEQS